MTTYRDLFDNDPNPTANLSWCRPFKAAEGRVYFTLCEGSINGLRIDGQDYSDITDDLIKQAAMIADDEYDEYRGWTDLELLLQSATELGCADCPYNSICEAMDEVVEDAPLYVD